MTEDEIRGLNRIVTMYLDFAENMADRNKEMKMTDWVDRLDRFLSFNEYEILNDAGKVTSKFAKIFAESEYEKFRVIQDKEFKSDFDKVVDKVKTAGEAPKYSEFSIKKALQNKNNLNPDNS